MRKTTGARPLRALLLSCHRWSGVLFGVMFVLLGLTGSFLVVFREVDVLLNPTLYASSPRGAPATLETVLAAATKADPNPIFSITTPDPVWPVWTILHDHPTPAGQYRQRWTTTIDPHDGKVLDRRNYTDSFVFSIYRLHFNLLLHDYWGKELVGGLGLLLVFLSLSGLYVWWPRGGKFLRAIAPPRGSPGRRWPMLHNTVGFWSIGALLIVATSGTALVFPNLLRPAVDLFSTTTAYPSPPSQASACAPLDPDLIVSIATRHSGLEVATLNPPAHERRPWRALLRPARHNNGFRSFSAIWIDACSGKIVHERSAGSMSAGDLVMSSQLWLHNGSIAGNLGRTIVFIAGLTPLLLFISGVLVWRRRARTPSTLRKGR